MLCIINAYIGCIEHWCLHRLCIINAYIGCTKHWCLYMLCIINAYIVYRLCNRWLLVSLCLQCPRCLIFPPLIWYRSGILTKWYFVIYLYDPLSNWPSLFYCIFWQILSKMALKTGANNVHNLRATISLTNDAKTVPVEHAHCRLAWSSEQYNTI